MLGYTVSRMAGLQERQARTISIEVWKCLTLRKGVSLVWHLLSICAYLLLPCISCDSLQSLPVTCPL